jgi:hypothetical protein
MGVRSWVYDTQIVSPDDEMIEQWTGLQLSIIGRLCPAGDWPAALLGPYRERRIAEMIAGRA